MLTGPSAVSFRVSTGIRSCVLSCVLSCVVGFGAAPQLGAQAPDSARLIAVGGDPCPVAASDSVGAPSRVSARPDSARRDSVAPRPSPIQSGDRAAIVLYASASAREVRFGSQPRISVRLCGAVTDSVRIVERRNLPDPVQPGVTYRDVYIAVEILGHLNAECLARRIGGAPETAQPDVCASLRVRDSARAAPGRRPPP